MRRTFLVAALALPLVTGCDGASKDSVVFCPGLAARFDCDPKLLIAPRAGTTQNPAEPPVLHARLTFSFDHLLAAGSVISIEQRYLEFGERLNGSELRYGLAAPIVQLGRAFGFGAHAVDSATGAVQFDVPVLAGTPSRDGEAPESWVTLALPQELPATSQLILLLGAPDHPSLGPATNPLPLEVELQARLLEPGKQPTEIAGSASVRIVDREADWLRVLGPATTPPDLPVTLHLVFENGWSGPQRSSCDALVPAGEVAITGPGGVTRATIEPPLNESLPNAARVTIPALPPGCHRLRVRFTARDGKRTLDGLSNPIVVGSGETPLWFGSLHNHTTVGGHATSTPSRALRYAREVSRLDFVALSEHREAPGFDTARLPEITKSANETGRFVAFLGWERTDKNAGHRHVIQRTFAPPPAAPTDLAAFAATVGHDPDVLVIAHPPLWNGGTAQRNYVWGSPGELPRQRLAEVYSWHGCSLEHDSPFPLHGNHEQEFPPEAQTDVMTALFRGHQLGLIADSDSHLGKPGSLVGIEWPKGRRYAYQGITAVRAATLERDALFTALDHGDCYGTTGARMLLSATRASPTSLRLVVHATAPLAELRVRTPAAELARRAFDAVAPEAGLPDAPLFLDPASGTWDGDFELAIPEGRADEPWIVEVAQQDFHHAWLLLPPAEWKR